jgi:hypothetical protein
MPKPIKHEDAVESALKVMRKATGDDTLPKATPPSVEPTKETISAVMAVLGRRGGRKGGPARAAALGPHKRRAIAKKAAAARWKRRKSVP